MVLAVEANVIGVVITSSPGPMFCVSKEMCRAAVQEFTAMACLAPRYSANSFSNLSVRGPLAIQPERSVSTTSSISACVISGRLYGIKSSLLTNWLISIPRFSIDFYGSLRFMIPRRNRNVNKRNHDCPGANAPDFWKYGRKTEISLLRRPLLFFSFSFTLIVVVKQKKCCFFRARGQ